MKWSKLMRKRKSREIILYVVFGIGTFIIDAGLFLLFNLIADLEHHPELMHTCSIFSTLSAVTFAYITNRKYVFRSKKRAREDIIKEAISFYGARMVTMVFAEIALHITVIIMSLPPEWMKILINVFVVILNYLFSKLVIFKKKKKV